MIVNRKKFVKIIILIYRDRANLSFKRPLKKLRSAKMLLLANGNIIFVRGVVEAA